MEVQHTPHFIHVGRVVWLGVALCWLFSGALSLLRLGILSLNVLVFSPAPLGLLPVFTQSDPLAVNATEAANLKASS
jgi:hypothetical protein